METSTSTSTVANHRFLPQNTFRNGGAFRNREFRLCRRRRRLKHLPPLRNHLPPPPPPPPPYSSSPFEFLSLAPFNWIPPAALGFASALALSLPNRNNQKSKIRNSDSISGSDSDSGVVDIGEWILFTSPTPFNRFVLLRCPSVSFEGGGEDVSDKLVKEEKHYVRLDSGRIQLKSCNEEREIEIENGNENEIDNEVEYQRECIRAEDGGVISLDLPASLDLNEEHGLDTTVVIILGTVVVGLAVVVGVGLVVGVVGLGVVGRDRDKGRVRELQRRDEREISI